MVQRACPYPLFPVFHSGPFPATTHDSEVQVVATFQLFWFSTCEILWPVPLKFSSPVLLNWRTENERTKQRNWSRATHRERDRDRDRQTERKKERKKERRKDAMEGKTVEKAQLFWNVSTPQSEQSCPILSKSKSKCREVTGFFWILFGAGTIPFLSWKSPQVSCHKYCLLCDEYVSVAFTFFPHVFHSDREMVCFWTTCRLDEPNVDQFNLFYKEHAQLISVAVEF